jgi:hypothetical protein
MGSCLHFFLLGVWVTNGFWDSAAAAAKKEKYQNIG